MKAGGKYRTLQCSIEHCNAVSARLYKIWSFSWLVDFSYVFGAVYISEHNTVYISEHNAVYISEHNTVYIYLNITLSIYI
jgi:hypothetical protein